jgi:hypothetical protein
MVHEHCGPFSNAIKQGSINIPFAYPGNRCDKFDQRFSLTSHRRYRLELICKKVKDLKVFFLIGFLFKHYNYLVGDTIKKLFDLHHLPHLNLC